MPASEVGSVSSYASSCSTCAVAKKQSATPQVAMPIASAAIRPAAIDINAPELASPPPARSQTEIRKGLTELETQIASLPAPNDMGSKSAKNVVKVMAAASPSDGSNGGRHKHQPIINYSQRAPHTHIHHGDFAGGMTKSGDDVLAATLGIDRTGTVDRAPRVATLRSTLRRVSQNGAPPHTDDGEEGLAPRIAAATASSPADDFEVESSVSSNPSVWEGNFPRKMMDLQWQFSCDPLRVTDAMSKHWSRLHAANRQMIPQPGGGLLLIEERIPHTSDTAIKDTVLTSGVAKKKHERVLPPLPLPPPVDTPRMRERLRAQTVPPLPQPPKVYLLALVKRGGRIEDAPRDDGSSIFSTSTAASGASRKSSGSAKAPSSVATSKHSSTSTKSAASSKGAESKVSTASRLQALEAKLAQERAEVASCASEVQRAQAQLDALEKLLDDKKPDQRKRTTKSSN